jgi:hypothetical protein
MKRKAELSYDYQKRMLMAVYFDLSDPLLILLGVSSSHFYVLLEDQFSHIAA